MFILLIDILKGDFKLLRIGMLSYNQSVKEETITQSKFFVEFQHPLEMLFLWEK
jgi:hypothetical protein